MAVNVLTLSNFSFFVAIHNVFVFVDVDSCSSVSFQN